jgi:hypothetical protein
MYNCNLNVPISCDVSSILPNTPVSSHHPMSSKIISISLKKLNQQFDLETASPNKIKDWLFDAVNLCENQKMITPAMGELKNDCKYKTLTEITSKYLSGNSSGFKDTFVNQIIQMFNNHKNIINQNIEIEKNELRSMIESIQLEWSPVKRDEMLRLLIHFYKTEREKLHKSFDGYVIDISELPSFLNAKVNAANLQDSSSRIQLMVRNEVHYTAVDIELSKNEVNCCIMDAYGEPKADIIEEILKQAGFKVYTAGIGETLQKDTRSCSLFALDHLMQSSKRPEFFQELKLKAHFDPHRQVSMISWYDFPFSFVKYAQDPSFFKTYAEKNPVVAHAMYLKGIETKLQVFKQIILKQFQNMTASDIQKIACAHFL